MNLFHLDLIRCWKFPTWKYTSIVKSILTSSKKLEHPIWIPKFTLRISQSRPANYYCHLQNSLFKLISNLIEVHFWLWKMHTKQNASHNHITLCDVPPSPTLQNRPKKFNPFNPSLSTPATQHLGSKSKFRSTHTVCLIKSFPKWYDTSQ